MKKIVFAVVLTIVLVIVAACILHHKVITKPQAAHIYPRQNGEPIVPDPTLTPGDPIRGITAEEVCRPGYAKRARHVTEAIKQMVFDEYHIDRHSDKFEVDHLCSLELGCSNDIKNLWPESYTTQPWNAHAKDKLENRLHYLVCVKKTLTLQQAQQAINSDWIAAYKQYVGN